MSTPKQTVLLIGGTGAQGVPIVKGTYTPSSPLLAIPLTTPRTLQNQQLHHQSPNPLPHLPLSPLPLRAPKRSPRPRRRLQRDLSPLRLRGHRHRLRKPERLRHRREGRDLLGDPDLRASARAPRPALHLGLARQLVQGQRVPGALPDRALRWQGQGRGLDFGAGDRGAGHEVECSDELHVSGDLRGDAGSCA
jgi:hypothetical protein